MIKIESLPLTAAKRGKKYPFAALKSPRKVGANLVYDSFLVKCGKATIRSKRSSIYAAYVRYWNDVEEIECSIRAADGGLRVWRLK